MVKNRMLEVGQGYDMLVVPIPVMAVAMNQFPGAGVVGLCTAKWQTSLDHQVGGEIHAQTALLDLRDKVERGHRFLEENFSVARFVLGAASRSKTQN